MSEEEKTVSLEKYRQDGYTVLTPITSIAKRIDDTYVAKAIEIRINPDPNKGEVYKVGSKNIGTYQKQDWVNVFALSAFGARKVGRGMGVVWTRHSRIDDRSDKRFVAYRAEGFYRNTDGRLVPLSGEAEVDLDAIEDEIEIQQSDRLQDLESFKKSKAYKERPWYKDWTVEQIKDDLVKREMTMIAKHKEARCCTKAEFRGLKSLGIPTTFLEPELKKPFVVLTVEYSPDLSKPEVADLHRRALASDTAALFGGRARDYDYKSPVEDVDYEEAAQEVHQIQHETSLSEDEVKALQESEAEDREEAEERDEKEEKIGGSFEKPKKKGRPKRDETQDKFLLSIVNLKNKIEEKPEVALAAVLAKFGYKNWEAVKDREERNTVYRWIRDQFVPYLELAFKVRSQVGEQAYLDALGSCGFEEAYQAVQAADISNVKHALEEVVAYKESGQEGSPNLELRL